MVFAEKTSLFCRFFSLCPSFDPYIKGGLNEGVRQKVEDSELQKLKSVCVLHSFSIEGQVDA